MQAEGLLHMVRKPFISRCGAGVFACDWLCSRLLTQAARSNDSLLAEIEAARESGAVTVAAHEPGAESANQAAEAEIFGDQGQSGG
jgi:hypothetical protein